MCAFCMHILYAHCVYLYAYHVVLWAHAEFEVIAQFVSVTAESIDAATAPPTWQCNIIIPIVRIVCGVVYCVKRSAMR